MRITIRSTTKLLVVLISITTIFASASPALATTPNRSPSGPLAGQPTNDDPGGRGTDFGRDADRGTGGSIDRGWNADDAASDGDRDRDANDPSKTSDDEPNTASGPDASTEPVPDGDPLRDRSGAKNVADGRRPDNDEPDDRSADERHNVDSFTVDSAPPTQASPYSQSETWTGTVCFSVSSPGASAYICLKITVKKTTTIPNLDIPDELSLKGPSAAPVLDRLLIEAPAEPIEVCWDEELPGGKIATHCIEITIEVDTGTGPGTSSDDDD